MIVFTAPAMLISQTVVETARPRSATLSAPLAFTGRGATAEAAPPPPRRVTLARPLAFTGNAATLATATAIEPVRATLAQPLAFTGRH